MTRRANGEGTRPRPHASGGYRSDVWLTDPETGVSRRVTIYGPTVAAVLDKVRTLRRRKATPDRSTLADYLERWLRDAAAPSVRPSTLRSYRGVVRNHLIPTLGLIRLDRLRPATIAAVLAVDPDDDAAAGARTRELAYTVLSTALARAVKWGLIEQNPAAAVDRPRVPKEPIAFLEPDEVRHLLDASRSDRLAALYVLLVFAGLRPGEAFALEWSQMGLDTGTIRITHTIEPTSLQRVEPKTKRARRTVDVGPAVVAALREHRKRMLVEGHAHGLVFPDTSGGPIRLSNLTRRSWKPLLERAGLPPRRLYDLRHTAAVLMIAAGVHPKVISERLGHASVAFTLDTYGHVAAGLGREAGRLVEAYVARDGGGNGGGAAESTAFEQPMKRRKP